MAPESGNSVAYQLRRLCGRAMTTLPASGAGLSVVAEDRQYSLLAAADAASERLEELQFVLGEGPCVDAGSTRRPVLVPHLADEGPSRWPVYTSAVRALGVGAIFAFPLQVGAAHLGVLDIFRTAEGNLSADELRCALELVDAAVLILLDGQERSASGLRPHPLEELLPGSADLFQAQGMVMTQTGGTLAEAMARIRAYAYAEDRRLIDVARDIVARELRFDHDE